MKNLSPQDLSIQKVTSRGQITLPIAWRRKNKSSFITVKEVEHGILISSAQLVDEKNREYTVFDALRDNGGKGVYADDLVALLKKINK